MQQTAEFAEMNFSMLLKPGHSTLKTRKRRQTSALNDP